MKPCKFQSALQFCSMHLIGAYNVHSVTKIYMYVHGDTRIQVKLRLIQRL